MVLLVGSAALAHWGLNRKEPRDIDLLGLPGDLKFVRHSWRDQRYTFSEDSWHKGAYHFSFENAPKIELVLMPLRSSELIFSNLDQYASGETQVHGLKMPVATPKLVWLTKKCCVHLPIGQEKHQADLAYVRACLGFDMELSDLDRELLALLTAEADARHRARLRSSGVSSV